MTTYSSTPPLDYANDGIDFALNGKSSFARLVRGRTAQRKPRIWERMRKVLVVDDTEDARVVLARLLRLGGYQTVLANNGPDALTAIDAHHPDLVLLDLMMPEMNGVEVLETLRANPAYKTLPVVLFTAVAEGDLIHRASDLGIQDLILKGAVNGFNLLERISRVLPAN